VKKHLGFLFLFFILLDISSIAQGRIRLRKVKDEPKTCTKMKVDDFLSRPEKKIFGTLRNSVVLEDDVVVIGDLGKKYCSWSLEQFNEKMNLSSLNPESGEMVWKNQIQFYIDEYKNILVPFVKKDQGYKQAVINLSSCDFENTSYTEDLQLPKCDPPKKTSRKKKKKNS